jgi:magnesium-protoporphyrin IX monomethyl ester (oxidative) cyclase
VKALLVYPLDRDFMPPSVPPLGLFYVATALKSAGHEVTILDLNVERQEGQDKLEFLLKDQQFGLVGVSSLITQYKKVKILGKLIKSIAPNTPLIMGGAGATSIANLYLEHCFADVVCLGEGEDTIVELADLISNKKSYCDCQGIAYKGNDGEAVTTSMRPLIEDVDSITFPDFSMCEKIDTYIENYLFRHGKRRGISVLTTRGCPNRCVYCMCNFGRKLRTRSLDNIFQEINLLVDKYKIEHVHFLDDTFMIVKDYCIKLSARMKKEFPGLTWSANARANMVSQENLKFMADNNCISLAYGIESGSPKILKYMKKNFTTKHASNAIKWTREAGINLRAYFMIGMPCETEETIRESVQFCKDNLVGGEFFFLTPIPGTEVYQTVIENGIIQNEDLYAEHLGEVRDFLVNVTQMENEELFTLKENAEREIIAHLKEHNIPIPTSTRTDPRETAKILPTF